MRGVAGQAGLDDPAALPEAEHELIRAGGLDRVGDVGELHVLRRRLGRLEHQVGRGPASCHLTSGCSRPSLACTVEAIARWSCSEAANPAGSASVALERSCSTWSHRSGLSVTA